MLTVNNIGSAPAGAIRCIASAESRDIDVECAQPNLPNAENKPVPPLDDDAAFQLQTDSQSQQRTGFQRSLLKPLIVVATAQYVLVTALAAFTAFVVASAAGKAVTAKLEPIIAALKRL